MGAIYLVCGAGGPQLKRNPLGSAADEECCDDPRRANCLLEVRCRYGLAARCPSCGWPRPLVPLGIKRRGRLGLVAVVGAVVLIALIALVVVVLGR
jgi:hypothetical protein